MPMRSSSSASNAVGSTSQGHEANGNRGRRSPRPGTRPWQALIEVACGNKPLQQFLRHRRPGLIVPRETPKHIRLFEPMFVELRRKFDEIGGDVGAGYPRIGHRREQAVQRMTELVKQGVRVVVAEQHRLAFGRLGEVADIGDERTDIAGELLLIAQRGHPGAAALRGPGKIVAEEQTDLSAVTGAHRPDAHVGMPDRHVRALGEA